MPHSPQRKSHTRSPKLKKLRCLKHFFIAGEKYFKQLSFSLSVKGFDFLFDILAESTLVID